MASICSSRFTGHVPIVPHLAVVVATSRSAVDCLARDRGLVRVCGLLVAGGVAARLGRDRLGRATSSRVSRRTQLGGVVELAQLPGVGETLARRIVERRQQRGPYRSPEELLNVQGVGKKTLERIKPFIVIQRSTPN